MIELPDLPQPKQHAELRDWAERLLVALRQEQDQLVLLSDSVPADPAAALAALDARVDALEAAPPIDPTPVGLTSPFAGPVAPAKWLFCLGQEVSRTTFALLDAAIGTTYGAYTNGSGGAGTTHLRLPDVRNRAIFGRDVDFGGWSARITDYGTGNPGVNGGVLGAVGGADRHTLTSGQGPLHGHDLYQDPTTGNNNGISRVAQNFGSAASGFMTNAGGSEAHPQLPPAIIMNYIIYAGV